MKVSSHCSLSKSDPSRLCRDSRSSRGRGPRGAGSAGGSRRGSSRTWVLWALSAWDESISRGRGPPNSFLVQEWQAKGAHSVRLKLKSFHFLLGLMDLNVTFSPSSWAVFPGLRAFLCQG